MTFHEAKYPRIIGKDGKSKSPEHYKNVMKKEYSKTLRSPIIGNEMITHKPVIFKPEIVFLNIDFLNIINEKIKSQAKTNERIMYVNRTVPQDAVKNLDYLVDCAQKYYVKTKDIQLTAAYYLKNIIVLQVFEDANHRTAIVATKFFLDSNGYNTKEISYWKNQKPHNTDTIEAECFFIFKERLLWYRQIEYHTIESPTNNYVLKFDDVETTENHVFNYCLNFIKNKLLI